MDKKKILIVDDYGFARVCSALLGLNGFASRHLMHADELNHVGPLDAYGLVIASYPYGAFIIDELKQVSVPLLVLSDAVSDQLLADLKKVNHSYFMAKPLDYDKFNTLVGQLLI